jgi:hypothetical protein
MSSEQEREEHTPVTQPSAAQPQEECISPDTVPSTEEREVREKRGPAERQRQNR